MKLYESIDSLSNVYLITEYVPGVSLHEYLKKQGENKVSEEKGIGIVC
jgi:serine/threonine protein kinase